MNNNEKNQLVEMNEEQANKELEKGYAEAEKLLQDESKLEKTLQDIESKLKTIPKIGEVLAYAPIMISLVRSYIIKEYTKIPTGTIIAIISALLYFLSPIDIIPDVITGAGYIDDVFVIGACIKLVGSDIEDYQKWRKENNKI